MALIVWNNRVQVGIWLMDTQHKRWIELINDLYDAMHVGKGKEVVERTLANVLTYTRRHFADEEAMLAAHGWSGFPEHKKEHDAFVEQVNRLQQRQRAGEVAISVEVMAQMRKWLVHHIQFVDRCSVPYLQSRGVR